MGKQKPKPGKLSGKETIPEFILAIAPAIDWYKQNCDPHQMIIIEAGVARLTNDEFGLPFEVSD